MKRAPHMRLLPLFPVLAGLLAASVTACSTEDTGPSYPAGCEPLLGETDCVAPFPSDYFRVADAKSRTGYVVAPSGAGKLLTADGRDGDVNAYAPDDGFSRLPSIVGALHGPIVATGLPTVLDDPAISMSATSATVILRADTGEFVAHYSDIPPKTTVTGARAIVLRPTVVLAPKTRYIVAIQRVRTEAGALADAGAGFARLRDKASASASLAALEPHYENDIFPVLAKAGVDRAGLQLAWDFTTGSEEAVTADLLAMREKTLAWLETHTPRVFDVVEDPAEEKGDLWKVFRGKIEGPRFVDKDTSGALIVRGEDGLPKENGVTVFEFVVAVPTSVRDRFEPGRYLALGHGFFGSRDEVTYGGSQKLATRLGAVLVGIDWAGFATADAAKVAGDILGNPGRTPSFRERVEQGLMNWLVTSRAMTTVFPTIDLFKRPASGPGVVVNDKGVSNAGKLLFDTEKMGYFGASQGQILGTVMAALNPDFARYGVNVGGAAYTHMMPRARPFEPLLGLVRNSFESDTDPNPVATEVFIAGLARKMEPIDPGIWAPFVLERKLPKSPQDRQVLVQTGLADSAVPNVGAFLLARAMKLSQTGPAAAEIPGIPTTTDKLASGLTTFDFGVDRNQTLAYAPVPTNDVHEGVRVDPNALTELERFYDGEGVIHPCSGACKAGTNK